LMSLRATSPEAYVLNRFEIEMIGCMGMRTSDAGEPSPECGQRKEADS
jgi:hypothetical protein